MITINLLKGRETKQTFFDFGEGSEEILERFYTKLVWEERKRVLEKEGYDFDDLDSDTNIDWDFQDVWQKLIRAHDEFAQVPRLKARIESAEQAWQKRLRTPVPDYIQYLRETKGYASNDFLKIADINVVNRLNQAVREFNALEPEEKAKNWFQYAARTRVILDNKTPYFIAVRGCRNCGIGQEMEKRGFNHETLAGCLISGCKNYGHDAASPFIDPEEVLEKAIELGDLEVMKNVRKYITSVKEKYGSCYENINVCLDSMIEELDANISPEE